MRRPFYGTDIPGLASTAVPQPPALPTEADLYAEGYAAGTAHAVSQVVQWLRAAAAGAPPSFARDALALAAAADVIERGQHLVDLAPGGAPGAGAQDGG